MNKTVQTKEGNPLHTTICRSCMILITLVSLFLLCSCSTQNKTPETPADASANTSDNPVNAASDASEPAANVDDSKKSVDISALNKKLIDAAVAGNAKTARKLIEEGADVNAIDDYGFSVLEIATVMTQKDVVKLLIESGADVNIVSDRHKLTPLLSLAIAITEADSYDPDYEHKALSVLEVLIDAKADVNFKSPDGVSALEVAAAMGYPAIAEALIPAGADINTHDDKHFSPLLMAAIAHDLKTLEVLVKAGADVNDKSSPDFTSSSVLILASDSPRRIEDACEPVEGIEGAYDCSRARDKVKDFSDGIKLLLDAGANPNQATDRLITPLMLAAKSGYLEGVKALLKAGADAKAINKHNNTALHYSANCIADDSICEEITKLIMDAGADISVVDGDGDTALMIATRHNRKSVEKLLMAADKSKKGKNSKKQSSKSKK